MRNADCTLLFLAKCTSQFQSFYLGKFHSTFKPLILLCTYQRDEAEVAERGCYKKLYWRHNSASICVTVRLIFRLIFLLHKKVVDRLFIEDTKLVSIAITTYVCHYFRQTPILSIFIQLTFHRVQTALRSSTRIRTRLRAPRQSFISKRNGRPLKLSSRLWQSSKALQLGERKNWSRNFLIYNKRDFSVAPLRDELFVCLTDGWVHRLTWTGDFLNELSFHTRRIPFCADQVTTKSA